MIEIRETSQFWHMWFVASKEADWLAMLFKHEGESWQCVYRFRYYKDKRAFDSEDVKSWYTIETDSTESTPPEGLVTAISKIAGLTASQFNGEVHSIPIRGNGIKAGEILMAEPWAHAQSVSTP